MNIGEAQEAPSEDAPLNPHVSAAELNWRLVNWEDDKLRLAGKYREGCFQVLFLSTYIVSDIHLKYLRTETKIVIQNGQDSDRVSSKCKSEMLELG
jgi:hypothetical protein